MPKGKKEKAMDHKRHMKLQKEKEQKRKEKRSARAVTANKLFIDQAQW